MTSDISYAVRTLLEARRSGLQVAPPFALPDRSAVYAIQDGVAQASGPVAGWKVGARTPTAEPNPAPLLGLLMDSAHSFLQLFTSVVLFRLFMLISDAADNNPGNA